RRPHCPRRASRHRSSHRGRRLGDLGRLRKPLSRDSALGRRGRAMGAGERRRLADAQCRIPPAGYNRRTVPASTQLFSHRSRRARVVSAVAVAALLLGSSALAPFSITAAFANESSVAAQLERHQNQDLTASAAEVQSPDIEVPGADLGSAKPNSDTPDSPEPVDAVYTLEQFLFRGVVNWGGYKFTFYS